MIRLSSLIGARVVTDGGRHLGRVEDVQVDDDGLVTMFALGPSGWLEREGGKSGARLVSWHRVSKIGKKDIIVREPGDGIDP